MKLGRAIALGLTGICAVLMFAALFVPWQGGAFFGFTVEPGLWHVDGEGFGSSERMSYNDDPDADQSLIIVARITALIAFIAAVVAVVLPIFPDKTDLRPVPFLMGGAGVVAALTVILFNAGVHRYYGPDADGFFQLTHGANLYISAAVLLVVAALVDAFLHRFVALRLTRDAPEGDA